MAGLIKRSVVEEIRQRARIDEIVGERVTLRTAGVGSLKGLCPFHDERTPSFQVRPLVGLWHCFGCGEGGDLINFLQRIDGLSFSEAVEYLAGRVGVVVEYEDGGTRRETVTGGTRQRLLEINRLAAQFYITQLASPAAAAGRAFLTERGFDRKAAEMFQIGFSPDSWDGLLNHLRGRGFTDDETALAGLSMPGQRGAYDRFRGRLMWPIHDLTGAVIGFGARKLLDADNGPKYLNTPETPLYHKSSVLYGVDLAKREIGQRRQVVIVEGYTDVMAAHLAGIPTAIATCGTAFGADHIRIVRRLLGDAADVARGEIIFTFDGDAAGQAAAMKAFADDQQFYAQTYVAIAPDGMDPCELRQARGDEAVRQLILGRTELFRFALRTALAAFDLDTTSGRVNGLKAAAPIIAGIRDNYTRADYSRVLAGWLGMDQRMVVQAVKQAARPGGSARAGARARWGNQTRPGTQPSQVAQMPPGAEMRPGTQTGTDSQAHPGGPVHPFEGRHAVPREQPGLPGHRPVSTRSLAAADPIARLERDVLIAVLQHPDKAPDYTQVVNPAAFRTPVFREVHQAIVSATAAGAMPAAGATWVEAVRAAAPQVLGGVLTELAVEPLPIVSASADDPNLSQEVDREGDYVCGIVASLREADLKRRIGALRQRLAHLDPRTEAEAIGVTQADLAALQTQAAQLTATQ